MDHPDTPLAQLQDLKELKRRYSIYDNDTLRRWLTVLTGLHRSAIESLLKDRDAL